MKKIYISALTVLVTAAALVTQSFAASVSSITVKTDKSKVSYTYNAADNGEAKADASKLFDNFSDASADEYSTESFTITSSSKDSRNIEVFLRLEAEETEDSNLLLDYYNFVITDAEGNVIYDDNEEPVSDADVKEISFGVFNTQFTNDTKNFTVDYKIDETLAENVDAEALAALSVSIASRPAEREQTAEYTVEVEAHEPETEAADEAAEAVAAAATETPAEAASEKTEPVQVKKVCGKDITAGRYLVSGNGIVIIESADGELKSETTVTDGKTDGVEGVEVFVATITDGDVITALPIAGQERPSIKFEKTNTGGTGSATSAAGRAGSNTTPSPAAAQKSNPKTGEDSAAAIAVIGLMAAAIAAVTALEVIKRRKNA